jgi:hypothetical protein
MKQQTPQHNQVKLPHEVFKMTSEAKTIDERVDILQKYGTFAIKTILQANYKESVQFDLPEGEPPYRQSPEVVGMQSRHIEKAIYDLGYLVKGSKKNISPVKKEMMFIRLLETVHPEDAKILVAMKDKKLAEIYPKLSEATVKKAYPSIFV